MSRSTCPECYKPTKPFGPPTPMPSGFTDQVMVCACGWVGVRSEVRDEPVQMSLPEFAKLVGKGVDREEQDVV